MFLVKKLETLNLGENSFYNYDFKIQWLLHELETSKIGESSIRVYAKTLSSISEFENRLEKDVCDFTNNELDQFVKWMACKSLSTLKVKISVLTNYIEYAMRNDRSINAMNELVNLKKVKDMSQYIDDAGKAEKYIYSYTEFNDMVASTVNSADAILLKLIWVGVTGSDLIELRTISRKDVDISNQRLDIRNSDGGIKRKIYVDKKFIKTLQESYATNKYISQQAIANGNKKYANKDLALNNFLVRGTHTNRDEDMPLDRTSVHRRIKTIADFYGKPTLTIKTLRDSAIMLKIEDIAQIKDMPRNDEILSVLQDFNMKKTSLTTMRLKYQDFRKYKRSHIE